MPHTLRHHALALFACCLMATGVPALAAGPAPAFGAPAPWSNDGAFSRSAFEQRNRTLVLEFYEQVHKGGRLELIEHFVAPDLIEHDPAVAAGRKGLADSLAATYATSPRPVLTVKRTIADGDLVLVHSQLSAMPGNEFSGTAQVDLYRVSGARIVEHWAIQQTVPASSASGRSMFSGDYRYAVAPAAPTQTREESNKALAIKLLTVLFAGLDTSVVDRYWSPNFLQHNAMAPDGTAPLKGVGFVPKPTPFGGWNTRIAVAEGDLVFVLSQSVAATEQLISDFNGTAAGDLFRIVDGTIVEHWDVLSPVPAKSLNGNSPFNELYLLESTSR